MRLLVLAGGFGTRLQAAVTGVPKALAPIKDVPFLHLQIEHWIAQGVSSFAFLLHHQADLIIDFLQKEQLGLLKDCEVSKLIEPTPMNTGGAIAYAVEKLLLSGDFLVTNADTWLGNGIRELSQAKAPAMAVVKLTDVSRYGRVELDRQHFVTAFHEKSSGSGNGWINAGMCRLDAERFKGWDHLPFSLERNTFPAMVARGELKAVQLQTDFIDIGVPEDYHRFCRWIAADRKGTLCN